MTIAEVDRRTDVLRIYLFDEFRVEFGSQRVDDAAWRLRKAQSLVKILALTPERKLHREQVMDMLWPAADASAALRSLNQALYAARQALLSVYVDHVGSNDVIRHHNQVLTLLPYGHVWIDAEAFEGTAREASLTGDVATFERAISYYRGDILPEDRYEDWALGRRNNLRVLYLGLLQEFAGRYESSGDLARAIDLLRMSLVAAPAAEDTHAALMRLYVQSGRRQQALEQYQTLSEELWRDGEQEPDAGTVALYYSILEDRSAATVTSARVGPAIQESASIFGRDDELASLADGVRAGLEGRGRVLLLAGDAGIGKTTLAEAVSQPVQQAGDALVFWGQCHHDEGVPAYWPWVQIVRAYLERHDDATLVSDLGRDAAAVMQIVPELRDRLPLDGVSTSSHGTRFQLFDAVSNVFKRVAERTPLLLVLDDLHWADRSSLLLLDYLSRDLRSSRAVVLGTYRESDINRYHPLHQTLGQLVRQPNNRSFALSGLSRADAARFMATTSGVEPPEQLVSAVHELTEGNPFFVGEVVRLLIQQGDLNTRTHEPVSDLAIPQGVREVMHQRLRQLSDDVRMVLDTGSVIGREFGIHVLRLILDVPAGRLVDILDEAVQTQILNEVPDQLGFYRFSHALIRETIYDELGTARRTVIHGLIAETLESLYAADDEPYLPELAHHFYRAAPRHDIGRTVDYLSRAGERAMSQVGFDEASGYFTRALQVLDLATPVDYPRRCSLLLALGDAQRGAGDSAQSRETCLQAATLARRLNLPEHLARAAATLGWASMEIRPYDAHVVSLLEEALQALGPADSIYRVQVLGALVRSLDYSGDIQRRAELGDEAVAVARRLNDPGTLVHALEGRLKAVIRPEDLDQTVADAEEIIRLAGIVGDSYMTILGHWWRIDGMLGKGNIAAVDQSIAIGSQLASERGEPRRIWEALCYQTMRALLAGRFADAERLAREALDVGQRPAPRPSWSTFIEHMFVIRREQGRLAEIESDLRERVENYENYPYYQALLAVLLAETDRLDDARAEFDALAEQDFDDIPRDLLWVITLALLSELVHRFNDVPRAEQLYELLRHYPDRAVVPDAIEVCLGSTAYYIGLLAETLGQDSEACKMYESAIMMNAAMDANAYLAHALYAHARCLLRSSGRGEAKLALQQVTRAFDLAHIHHMSRLASQCVSLRAEIERAIQD